jgi:hypothetical protein
MEGEMNHGMEDYVFAQHKKLNGYDYVAKYLQSHLFENILSEVHISIIGILYFSLHNIILTAI